MRRRVLLSAFILTLFVSCSDTQYSDKKIEQQANKIIKLLDTATIDTFKHWGYGIRGEAEIWQKLDTPGYSCIFFDKDTLKLSVGLIENFKKDFPYSISVDTNKIYRVIFKKMNEDHINVSAWTNIGKDTVIVGKINLTALFAEREPFQYFARLSKLKDSLKIIGTFYRPDIGNFIQFYLTNQRVLTYIPDKLEINPKIKDIWMGYFLTGKMLSKNWNLRKLNEHLDNG